MMSSKPQHCYRIASYSDLGVFVDCLWEGAFNLNIVGSESRGGTVASGGGGVDGQKWTERPGEEKQKGSRAGERDRWTTRECLGGREKQERCLHLLIHAEHTSMLPSPRWSTQGSNDECILSQSPLLTPSPSTILLSADQAEPLHYSLLLFIAKWAALRMNLWSRQHKSSHHCERRSWKAK